MFEIHRCLPHKYGEFVQDIKDKYFNVDINLFAVANEYYVLVNTSHEYNEIVAFGMIRGWAEDEQWDEKVLGIWVNPLYRRRGCGRIMMQWLEFIARQRDLHSLRLHVDVNNTAALELYDNMGYIGTGKKYRFMHIMRKLL